MKIVKNLEEPTCEIANTTSEYPITLQVEKIINGMRMRLPSIHRVVLRSYCTSPSTNPIVTGLQSNDHSITIFNKSYEKDEYTNLTPRIASFVGRNKLLLKFHPLCLVKQKITEFFYENFIGRTGNPTFSVYDNISPVVKIEENFDSLFVPPDHVSRSKSDSYYINKDYLLRSHTTAHQSELISMGLDNFLVFGDCYRRDEIDAKHYPVFHQVDGVYSLSRDQIVKIIKKDLQLFSKMNAKETKDKQRCYTLDATRFVENHLKETLIELMKDLFGKEIEHRWVTAYFPFTHPSWELEILLNDKWIEILGCGIIKHEILRNAGAGDRIGWAFGIGLERIAMQRYQIPDIRIFWSEDTGVTSQFEDATPDTEIVYKPISKQPQCINDLSFFLSEKEFSHNDFYDLVRNIGGDFIEQVRCVDEFYHERKQKKSRTYRIVYRHLERPLKKSEVNILHARIANSAIRLYDIEKR